MVKAGEITDSLSVIAILHEAVRRLEGGVLIVSCDHVADHVPVDVGEPEVAARVAVGQAGVVQAHQVQDGGVEVVDVHGVLGGAVAVLVGDAVAESRPSRRRRRGSR